MKTSSDLLFIEMNILLTHAITVNLTNDGHLSAKEILGNPKKMQERQDRYAKEMEAFGLERGKKNTGIKHEYAKEYQNRTKY